MKKDSPDFTSMGVAEHVFCRSNNRRNECYSFFPMKASRTPDPMAIEPASCKIQPDQSTRDRARALVPKVRLVAELTAWSRSSTVTISSSARFKTTVLGQRYCAQAGETLLASLEACTSSPIQLYQSPRESKSIQHGSQQ